MNEKLTFIHTSLSSNEFDVVMKECGTLIGKRGRFLFNKDEAKGVKDMNSLIEQKREALLSIAKAMVFAMCPMSRDGEGESIND